jgi:hypothetical protein
VSETEYPLDPFYLCELWLRANGYADLFDGAPEDVDLDRLDEGLAAYANSDPALA